MVRCCASLDPLWAGATLAPCGHAWNRDLHAVSPSVGWAALAVEGNEDVDQDRPEYAKKGHRDRFPWSVRRVGG
jgi:hypothetical protein